MNIPKLREGLSEPETRANAALEVGEWFRNLRLLFDSEFETAVKVGALVSIGLNKEFEQRERTP